MVHIKEEGKFNENAYILDAEFMKTEKTCAIYIIEKQGKRLMLDTGESLSARRLMKKIKNFNLYPIHQIVLTHAHWDHIQALPKLKRLMKDTDLEVYAHQNAVDILKNPERLNEFFGYHVDPIENVIPLKQDDVLDLGGLKLKIHEFFGHTQDSIGIQDIKNQIIYVGDAIIDKIDKNTFVPVLFGPDFDEESLLKTYEKLRNMKDELNAIALAHYGIWKGEDFDKIIDDVEDLYYKAKNLLIEAYNDNLSVKDITRKYHDEIIPDSEIFSEANIMGLQWNIEQNIETLKAAGFIR
ncbi:MAG: MBL fold metallo-hydrolase [Candidatus Lokiarchaeota archaeon]|nr:MBL fold metallo-hydrolase [Candidatus Lokiarchaeota archaeon]